MSGPDRPSIRFFEEQFRRQTHGGEAALNPFERRVLPYVAGDLLDVGCGLGHLSVAAARRGCRVRAIDASPTAVERLRVAAREAGVAIDVDQADLTTHRIEGTFDTVVAIGILMFFARPRALELLDAIVRAVRPGGVAAITVLIEGTTFMAMFDPVAFHVFRPTELEERFAGWAILESAEESFEAPGGTRKRFTTLVARKPTGAG